jgi:hypothetical protein
MQPIIAQVVLEEPDKIGIGLQRDQDGIWPHALQNLFGKRSHARPVLEKHSTTAPVHFREYVVDQKAGAGNETTQHPGMFEKVAPEEKELLGARYALW